MYLYEIVTYITTAQSYWDGILDATDYTNIPDLKSAIATYLDALETAQETYIATSSRTKMTELIPVAYGYMSMKYGMTLPAIAPAIPTLITNGDIRTLYRNWTYTLPDHTGLFTHAYVTGSSGDGVISTTASYTTMLSTIGASVTADNAAIDALKLSIGSGIGERVIYMIFATPNITTPAGYVSQTYIKETMHLLDVLTAFGWTYIGLNDA